MARVLVVEDNREVALPLIMLLEIQGHSVRYSADGAAGLEAVSKEYPDLIVLDVDMPKLTGPEMAYQLLVEDCGRENIPILLLSGVYQLHKVAKTVGTPYFLSKPYNLDEFLALLARILSERQAPHPALYPRPGQLGGTL